MMSSRGSSERERRVPITVHRPAPPSHPWIGGLLLALAALLALVATSAPSRAQDLTFAERLATGHIRDQVAAKGMKTIDHGNLPQNLPGCLCSNAGHTTGVGVAYDGNAGNCHFAGLGSWTEPIPNGKDVWNICVADQKYPDGRNFAATYIDGRQPAVALTSILAATLAAIGAWASTLLAGLGRGDVLGSLRDLLRGRLPSDGFADWKAQGEAAGATYVQTANIGQLTLADHPGLVTPIDPGMTFVGPKYVLPTGEKPPLWDGLGPEDQAHTLDEINDLAGAMNDVVDKLTDQGYYIANEDVFHKAWNNIPHLVTSIVDWMKDSAADPDSRFHIDPSRWSDPDSPYYVADPDKRAEMEAALHTHVTDPHWGQCGEAAEWGDRHLTEAVKKIFGPDAALTQITVQSENNPFANHIANEVILPDGQRYVVDMWASMVEHKPKIYREDQWIEKWRNDPWIGRTVTINRTGAEGSLDEHVRKLGPEAGLDEYTKQSTRHHPKTGDHPASAELSTRAATALQSYTKHPWKQRLVDTPDPFLHPPIYNKE